MKILLIAGHGAGDPGATARFGGTTYREADETRRMVGMLVPRLAKYGIEAVLYNLLHNAFADWKSGSLLSRAKFGQYDYVLELHLNACKLTGRDGRTKGVECYVTTSEKGTGVEEAICRNIAAVGFTNRGVKRKNFAVIAAAKRQGVSSALLEMCFIDDYDDITLYAKSREKVADAIVAGICEGFGVTTPQSAGADSSPDKGSLGPSQSPAATAPPKGSQVGGSKVKLQQWGCRMEDIGHLAWVYDGPETVTQCHEKTLWQGRKADVMCNGELFTAAYKAASGCSDHVTQTLGFAFVDGKTPVLSYANNRNAKDWIGSYPVLLRSGKVAFEKVPAGLGGKRARMALAVNDTHFAFFYVREEDGCTLEDFAIAILGRGFHTAINLDGGGSAACITPYVTYDQGRKVRGKIALWKK